MLFVFLFFVELFILFLVSKSLINCVFSLFYKITRSKKVSVYLLSVLFLPGTLVHEFSHYFMSMILLVPAGNMTLIPKLVGDGIKMGGVQIAKTDPIRRTLIGMAPFIFGSSILIGMFFYAARSNLFGSQIAIVIISYLVFEIGNTMFSSKKDMEGALELLITLILLIIIFYVVGFRLPTFNPSILLSNPALILTFQKADIFLTAPLAIDLSLITIFRFLTR